MPSLEENKGLFNKAHPPPSGVNASGGLFSSLHGQAGDFRKATKNRGWIPMALPRMQGSPDMLNSVVGKSGSDTWKIRLSTVTYGKSLTGGVGKS